MLLTHRNLEEAAHAVGIDPKTLLRWLQQPEFDARGSTPAIKPMVNPSRGCSRPLAPALGSSHRRAIIDQL